MTVLSLPLLIMYSLVVSALLIWLNRRGVGPLGAVGGTVTVSLLVLLAGLFALGTARLSRQAVQQWVLFVLLPTAAIWAVSRLGSLQRRPWWLLLAGPVTCMFAIVCVAMAYNILTSNPR